MRPQVIAIGSQREIPLKGDEALKKHQDLGLVEMVSINPEQVIVVPTLDSMDG